MQNFSKNHPILFTILLFFAGLVVALPFAAVTGGYNADLGSAIGRIIAGVLIFLIFRNCFKDNRWFSGLKYLLPALVLPVWNIVYQVISGLPAIRTGGDLFVACICALAPAVFEEVIFRGIFLEKLRENGRSAMESLIISAVVFGLVHLTNAVGGAVANTLVQTLYAIVIGLFFGAVYLKTRDIVTVILAHFMTDFTTQIFVQNPNTTSTPLIIAFVIILLALAAWSVWQTSREKGASASIEEE